MNANTTTAAVTKVAQATNAVVIRVQGLVPEMNKATRKLAEEEATQAVRRAVNVWLYSQEG